MSPGSSEDVELDDLIDEAEAGLARVESARETPDPASRDRAAPRTLPTIGQFGPYAIVGRLALGGMAEILLAREDSAEAGSRLLVVKRILAEYGGDKAFVDMFLDEARVMMRLHHPNVCHVYKFGQQDGAHFIAMEWVDGKSLGKLIRKSRQTGGIPVAVACSIVASVAEALDHAHHAEAEDGTPLAIVHRDVTPDNIMISYDGAVKLLDFGIAKAELRAHKTQAGVVKGKFAYMAPEQCRGKELDLRVDVFALGVCLYEALTGRPLYRRDTEFETMEAIVRGPVPKLADRIKGPPPELEAIIARCLAKKAEDRFPSAGALSEALSSFLAKRNEVVTGRRVKELMTQLFGEEKRRGPIVDSTPFGSSFHPSGEAELFALDLGEDEPPDLPMPDLDLEPSMTPAYQGDASFGLDPEENPRPGGALPIAPRADRRPAPTAPPRPVLDARPAPASSGSRVGLVIGGALILVLLVAGGAYLALGGFGATEAPVERAGPAATVRTGTLEVRSDPPGALLFVDEIERGPTPVTVPDLETGTHRVRLVLAGHVTHDGTVEIRADQTRTVTQPLEAVPAEGDEAPTEEGRMNLTASPNVRVFHDGEDLGMTPLRDLRLPAGVVRLELELPDGRREVRAVLVQANERRSTHLNL